MGIYETIALSPDRDNTPSSILYATIAKVGPDKWDRLTEEEKETAVEDYEENNKTPTY